MNMREKWEKLDDTYRKWEKLDDTYRNQNATWRRWQGEQRKEWIRLYPITHPQLEP